MRLAITTHLKHFRKSKAIVHVTYDSCRFIFFSLFHFVIYAFKYLHKRVPDNIIESSIDWLMATGIVLLHFFLSYQPTDTRIYVCVVCYKVSKTRLKPINKIITKSERRNNEALNV